MVLIFRNGKSSHLVRFRYMELVDQNPSNMQSFLVVVVNQTFSTHTTIAKMILG